VHHDGVEPVMEALALAASAPMPGSTIARDATHLALQLGRRTAA